MTGRKTRFIQLALLFVFMAVSVLPSQALAGDYGTSLLKLGSKGTAVSILQQDLTALGYNTYGIDGIFGANTNNAVLTFQKTKGLAADALVGTQTKTALNNALQGKQTYVIQPGDSLSGIAGKYGINVNDLMKANGLTSWVVNAGVVLIIPVASVSNRHPEMADWWTVVDKAFPRKANGTLTDINTGITLNIHRYGGSNHIDAEPITAADTAKLKAIYGGQWSWSRRAVMVNINGRVFAGSMNGMPHGGQDYFNNNFDGQFCIHFLNSRTHGTNRVDAAHQAAVHKAANYTY
jgi:hypothetical protein